MKGISSFCLVFLFYVTTFSQSIKVQVVDNENLKPIKNVTVYKQSELLATTGATGEVMLPAVSDSTLLKFRFTAYEDKTITIAELKEMNYIVKLSRSIVTLTAMTVTASKWKENKSEVPGKVTTLIKDDAAFFNPQTTADLLSSSNEVFVQKSQLGGGSPMVRGFSANSLLYVVDGVRMNNAIYRSGNLQNVISLDANTMENTEILFGPGSIMYGSDAMGGVFSFTSRNPDLSTDGKLKVSGDAMGRFSSADFEKTGHVSLSLGGNKFGSLTGFTFSDFDDLRMGKNGEYYSQYKRPEYIDRINGGDSIVTNSDAAVQTYSGYNQINLLQKLLFCPSDKVDFQTGFYFSTTSDIPRYDKLIEYKSNKLRYSEWYYGPQKWMMVNAGMHLINNTAFFEEMKLVLAYQNYEESRHNRKYKSDDLISNEEKVDFITGNIDLNKKAGAKSVVYYGIEAVYNNVESVGKNTDIVTGSVVPEKSRYPSGYNDYATGALYGIFKTNWNRILTTVEGVRYSYIHLESLFEDPDMPYQKLEINNGAFNASIGCVVRPSDLWQIRLNTASGFRAPNIDDVTKMFDPDSGSVVVPNKNLKPEYAYNVDLGTEGRIGNVFGIEATIFATYVKNLMVRDNFTFNGQQYIIWQGELKKIVAVVNKDEGYIFGVSGAAKFDITPFLALHNYITYTWGRDSDGNPIRHITPLFGSSHCIVTKNRFKADFNVVYNSRISHENLAPTEIEKPYMYAMDKNGDLFSPAWYTLNLKTSFMINKYLTLDAGIENITNYCYRTYSSGIVAPGVNGVFTVRAGF